MKVVQVVPTLFPTVSYGGGSIVPWELAIALRARGHNVTIVTTDAGDAGRREKAGLSVKDGIRILRIRNLSNKLAFSTKIFTPFTRGPTLREIIREADVVHSHDFRTILNLRCNRIALRESVPLIVQTHGTIRTQYNEKMALKRVYDRFFGKGIAKRVDAWIALSQVEKEQLEAYGLPSARIRILPNGIDTSYFESPPERIAARVSLGLDSESRIILFMGRIHPMKGIDLLIDSMPHILAEIPRTKLIVAGPDDGDQKHLVERINELGIGPSVSFFGLATGDSKRALFASADLLALPSLREAFPVSILEAAAAGLPIVTTSNSDIANEINDICGLTTDRNPGSLGKAIVRVLSNPGLWKRYSDSGRSYAAKYTWDSVIGRYIELYESLLTQEGDAD